MKSLFINIAALALFSVFAAVSGIISNETILFQIAVQWIVNELWFDVYLVPVLLMQLFGRKGEERDAARQRRAARWTSFCLLLIPAILFGIISLIESLTTNALGNWLGLSLDAALFTCSFAGFFLLFVLSLFTGAMPLSVQASLENFFDEKFDNFKEEVKAEVEQSNAATPPPLPVVAAATCDTNTIPSRHSRLYAAHERDFARKQQTDEELILTTAPAGEAPMGDETQSFLIGGGFGAVGLFLLYNAYVWQQTGELAGVALWLLYLMGAVFVLFALPVVIGPLRWRKRLNSIDYFITNRRLVIYRGDEVYSQPWKEPCICHLTLRAGTRGDIAVIRKGMSYHLLRTFFKRWAGFNEEETRRSFDKGTFNNGKDMQTQALINVEGAEAIHALIAGLREGAQQERER